MSDRGAKRLAAHCRFIELITIRIRALNGGETLAEKTLEPFKGSLSLFLRAHDWIGRVRVELCVTVTNSIR